MLDSQLAELYEVPTKRLNEAVNRNRRRFPEDFMFRLTTEEAKSLTSQIAISSLRSQIATSSYGGPRYLPSVFTEQRVAMLSPFLNSQRTITVKISTIATLVRPRPNLPT